MADLKKLFRDAQKASQNVESAQAALDAALAARSEVIKAFVEGAKGQKGPFRLPDGGLVTVRCRTSYQKDAEGDFILDGNKDKIPVGETWFFVNLAESKAIEI